MVLHGTNGRNIAPSYALNVKISTTNYGNLNSIHIFEILKIAVISKYYVFIHFYICLFISRVCTFSAFYNTRNILCIILMIACEFSNGPSLFQFLSFLFLTVHPTIAGLTILNILQIA